MDTNKDRQSGYGEGEYGVNVGRGFAVLLLSLAVAALLISMLPQ